MRAPASRTMSASKSFEKAIETRRPERQRCYGPTAGWPIEDGRFAGDAWRFNLLLTDEPWRMMCDLALAQIQMSAKLALASDRDLKRQEVGDPRRTLPGCSRYWRTPDLEDGQPGRHPGSTRSAGSTTPKDTAGKAKTPIGCFIIWTNRTQPPRWACRLFPDGRPADSPKQQPPGCGSRSGCFGPGRHRTRSPNWRARSLRAA